MKVEKEEKDRKKKTIRNFIATIDATVIAILFFSKAAILSIPLWQETGNGYEWIVEGQRTPLRGEKEGERSGLFLSVECKTNFLNRNNYIYYTSLACASF